MEVQRREDESSQRKLKKHQQEILDKAVDKCGLFLKPRCGKTPLTIRLAAKKVKSCLVVIPKYLDIQWRDEIEKWNNSNCVFHIISKERFRIDMIDHVVKRGRGQTLVFSDKVPKCDMVVIEECHRQASNYSNKFFKCLIGYIEHHNVQHVLLLSGTPWNKNPWSVYSYLAILGKPQNFLNWQREFFIKIGGGIKSFYKPNEAKFPKLAEILKKIGYTVSLEDIMEVAEDEETVEYFDLCAEQRKAIKNITDTNPAVRYVKQHQLEQGVLKSDGYSEDLILESEKDDRILEIAEENDKFILVCTYLNQIDKYKKILRENGYKVLSIQGEMEKPLEEVRREAEDSEKCIIIIQSKKSDGYDLKSFSTMVFSSMDYSYICYEQMRNRMKSMEKKEPCQYIHLLTRGKSVDQAVYNSIKKGEDFSNKLYE